MATPGLARLTSGRSGHTLARAVVLATSYGDTGPGPVRAVGADDGNVRAAGLDSTLAIDLLDGEVGDGHPGGGLAVEVPVVVVLLDEDTVAVDV